ncbi:5'-AMP-activated protein kinase subunit beta-1-like protein [Sarcoptes scabiei]|uniref:5'-AMP-activated protein kinase subunit beta-1 n=1 Tax=Sarcoptes scabiei TaxID=52283 RepID=A0A132ACE3_SARSC|nr:5'-AMP-activated protein kinase subunit beta-1-like protein [Sarcoptes scabiei]
MGNANANSKQRIERPYSIDGYDPSVDRRESPRPGEFGSGYNDLNRPTESSRRPVLCYQSSSDYGNEDTSEDFKNYADDSSSAINALNDQILPIVFKWDGGGKEAYIVGTFSDWKPVKMVKSQADFVTIVDIPAGVHKYKFVVDGVEKVDKNASLDESESNNVLNVQKSDFEVFDALAQDLASNNNNNSSNATTTAVSGSPPGSYSQDIPTFPQESGRANQGPPILPPQLLQVILNNPSVNFGEPTLLPQPNHVMLNHLYALSIKDGVMVLSAIHRYRKKYVTTMLYKPI